MEPEEYLEIINRNGEVIGCVPRSEVHGTRPDAQGCSCPYF